MSDEQQSPRQIVNIHAHSVNLTTAQNAASTTTVNANLIGHLTINESMGSDGGMVESDAGEPCRRMTKTRLETMDDYGDAVMSPTGDTIKIAEKISIFPGEQLRPKSRVYRGKQEFIPGQWREVAVKLIPYDKHSLAEVRTLTKLNHPNIVRIYDAGQYHDTFHWIYIAMELCSCNLQTYVKNNKVTTGKAKEFFKQLVDGLAYIHANKITHRDIKPDNILVSKCGQFMKLSDFGISKEIPEGQTSVTNTSPGAGADGYRPPELYREGTRLRYSSDIFPLGIVTFYIFTNGKHPFGSNPYDWSYNIRKNQNFSLSLLPVFPEPHSHKRARLIRLLELMLQNRPEARLTIRNIQEDSYFRDDGIRRSRSAGHNYQGYAESRRNVNKTRCKSCAGESGDRESHKDKDSQCASAFILFDSKSKYLYQTNAKGLVIEKILEFHDNMKKKSFRALSLNGDIYVLLQDQTMLVLSLESKIWRCVQSFNGHHGWWPVCATSDDSMYIVGGSGLVINHLVTEYDPESNSWRRLKNLPAAVRDSSILVSGNSLVCFGGETEHSSYSRHVFRMDLDLEEWSELPRMRCPRTRASATERNGNYYLFGGFGNEKRTHFSEMFDVISGQWTELAPMLYHRSKFQSYPVQGGFVCIGGDYSGQDENGGSHLIERYDVAKNEWTTTINLGKLIVADSVALYS